ncbi:proteasome assembly chaperone 1-like [Ornithodoros turicata]
MATFFGEVLPIHSRAVDDNEDEDAETPSVYFDLDSKYDDVSLLPSYSLICVATGLAPSIFVQSYLVPTGHEVLGTIRLNAAKHNPDTTLGLDYSKRPNTLGKLLHHSGKDGVLYCVCDKDVPHEHCATIARHFVDLSKSSSVTSIAFTSLPASDYKTKRASGKPEYPVLRRLMTSACCSEKSEDGIPFLETPNTVPGLSAAVLTECEVRELPGVLVVGYGDTPELDSSCVRAYEPALKLACLQGLSQPVESCRSALLRHVRDARIDRGNLYF